MKNDDIAENEYNLSVSSYVEQEDKREVIDIDSLNASIAEIVEKGYKLRQKVDDIINSL